MNIDLKRQDQSMLDIQAVFNGIASFRNYNMGQYRFGGRVAPNKGALYNLKNQLLGIILLDTLYKIVIN